MKENIYDREFELVASHRSSKRLDIIQCVCVRTAVGVDAELVWINSH